MFDLRNFDDDFAPSEGGGNRKPGLDILPDGDYDFEIDGAEIKETKAGPLVAMSLVVCGGPKDGATVERPAFLKTKENAAILGKELATLGFDADLWLVKNGRPFSQELPKAVKCLAGIRFQSKKVHSEKDGKTYHNCYINKRIDDDRPKQFGPAELNAAVKADEVPW